MKKIRKPLLFSLIILCFTAFVQTGLAQGPPPPPSDKGTITNQGPAGPAGAPIDGGTSIFLILAAAYGFKKFKRVRG